MRHARKKCRPHPFLPPVRLVQQECPATKESPMPSSAVIRYKTHPRYAEENAALVKAVFQALQRARPAGLRYQCLRGVDGVTFTHVVTTDDALAQNPLPVLPEFQAFVTDLDKRCAEPPARIESELLGRYEG
jgi:hypothetical protein